MNDDRQRDPEEVTNEYITAGIENLVLFMAKALLDQEDLEIFVENLRETLMFTLNKKKDEHLDEDCFQIVEKLFRNTLLDEDEDRPNLILITPRKTRIDPRTGEIEGDE